MKRVPLKCLVENVSTVRRGLPSVLKRLDSTLTVVTSGSRPAGILLPLEMYESLAFPERRAQYPLVILGAKSCPQALATETARAVNEAAPGLISRLVFVYSAATLKYAGLFDSGEIRLVAGGKPGLPAVTSLKNGVSALSRNDDYFVFTMLSKPALPDNFLMLASGIEEARRSGREIVILRAKGLPIHPVAMSTALIGRILSVRKELGIPYIINKFRDRILYLDVEKLRGKR